MMIMGIKSACIEFSTWEGAAKIFYNKATNEVWTEIYNSDDSVTKYTDSTIIEVYSKTIEHKGSKLTPAALNNIIAKILSVDSGNNFYLHI